MAVAEQAVVIEGFESLAAYHYRDPVDTSSASSVLMTAGVGSGSALRRNDNFTGWSGYTPFGSGHWSANDYYHLSFYAYTSATPASGGQEVRVRLQDDRTISTSDTMAGITLYQGSVWAYVPSTSSGTNTLVADTVTSGWNHWEMIGRLTDSTDASLYKNGNLIGTVATGTAGDTRFATHVCIYMRTDGNVSLYVAVDHLYVGRSTTQPTPGEIHVNTRAPTGTAGTQWAGSDGNTVDNHLLVDDLEDDGADYVSDTAGNTNTQLFTFGSLPATVDSVVGVTGLVVADRTDTGTDVYATVLDSSGSQTVATSPLATTKAAYTVTDHLDPNTATAWTKSGAEAVRLGVRS